MARAGRAANESRQAAETGVREDEVQELTRTGGTEHTPAKAQLAQLREVARVIDVGVREYDGVDGLGGHGKVRPVAEAKALEPLRKACDLTVQPASKVLLTRKINALPSDVGSPG